MSKSVKKSVVKFEKLYDQAAPWHSSEVCISVPGILILIKVFVIAVVINGLMTLTT
jgi:hypothetical protein